MGPAGADPARLRVDPALVPVTNPPCPEAARRVSQLVTHCAQRLQRLGYTSETTEAIVEYIAEHGHVVEQLGPGRNVDDAVVIGGGINGVSIARDAAGRGQSVLLCEMGDLAGATSSASSKMIRAVRFPSDN